MKFTKEHEGKIILALGTGNNSRRLEGNIHNFLVTKVYKKYVGLKIVLSDSRYGYEDKYSIISGATESEVRGGYEYNAGYLFFNNIEEIEEHRMMKIYIKEISSFFREYSWNLPPEKIREIYKIINNNEVKNKS